MESVYSRRSKKTSLIAGSIGLPSSMKKSSAAAVGGRRRAAHHGRALSVSSVASSNLGSMRPPSALSPRNGQVLRRSSGGGGRLKHRRPGSDMPLSSSVSPVRQIRRDDGGGGHRSLRAIGPRAATSRRLELASASSSMPESLVGGSGPGNNGAEGRRQDTTAAKLERLHSLSAGLGAAPATPTLIETVRSTSEGDVIRRKGKPQGRTASTAAAAAARPSAGGLLDPLPTAPKLDATTNSVSEGGGWHQARVSSGGGRRTHAPPGGRQRRRRSGPNHA